MPDSFAGGSAGEEKIAEDAAARFAAAANAHALDETKAEFLNRRLRPLLRQLGALPPDKRPAAGQKLNALRRRIEELYEDGRRRLREDAVREDLARRIDTSLPGRTAPAGTLHPVSLAAERAAAALSTIGFTAADGPEIETDYYNFTALNHPPDHPARSMHDTFYTADGRLLRTHTSPVQIRRMLAQKTPPIRIIAPGRVYRCDHDATHSPMFHQIEGMWIDGGITFAALKGVLGAFFRAFFDDDNIVTRFRPSFFPFTEPSAECDILRGGKWLEVGGCGMIHPNVLKHGGIDPQQWRGFAFGMGVERLAMLLYGISDIRLFYENDLRFLAQFSGA
ncbi:MAG: phenylalanine--tRNA ligase subunit alpha [Gammaproteobacteria bacterium]